MGGGGVRRGPDATEVQDKEGCTVRYAYMRAIHIYSGGHEGSKLGK
jgi:hypothetical protein